MLECLMYLQTPSFRCGFIQYLRAPLLPDIPPQGSDSTGSRSGESKNTGLKMLEEEEKDPRKEAEVDCLADHFVVDWRWSTLALLLSGFPAEWDQPELPIYLLNVLPVLTEEKDAP